MFNDLIGLKKRIHAGEKIYGVGMPANIKRDRFDAILDKGPYDFVNVDSQHSPFNEERLVEFCAMAEERDVFVQFRIKHTRHAYLIGNNLDLGPCGIEVPQTELESTTEEAVQAFYYPPEGGRSLGGAARRGAKERQDWFEYIEWWNRFGVLWLQIESIESATHVRQLAKQGVDCFSFGPADLSINMRSHPQHPFKSLDDCVSYVVRALEGTTVAVCFRNYNPDLREKYADMGVRVFLELPQV